MREGEREAKRMRGPRGDFERKKARLRERGIEREIEKERDGDKQCTGGI